MAPRDARFVAIPAGSSANSARDSEQTSRSDALGVGIGYDGGPGVASSARLVTYRVWAYTLSASAFLGTTLYAVYEFIGR